MRQDRRNCFGHVQRRRLRRVLGIDPPQAQRFICNPMFLVPGV